MRNPYLVIFRRGQGDQLSLNLKAMLRRVPLCQKYAWAIPTIPVIRKFRKLPQPFIELGAGTGYWASLMHGQGIKISAYDKAPPSQKQNPYCHSASYFPVRYGTPAIFSRRKTRWQTLVLCWPSYSTPFAFEAITQFQGSHLIYVGEGNGGCTGDDRFHKALEAQWTLLETHQIPQWWGIHDLVWIYRKIT